MYIIKRSLKFLLKIWCSEYPYFMTENLFINILAAELSALVFSPHILRLRKPNLLQNLN